MAFYSKYPAMRGIRRRGARGGVRGACGTMHGPPQVRVRRRTQRVEGPVSTDSAAQGTQAAPTAGGEGGEGPSVRARTSALALRGDLGPAGRVRPAAGCRATRRGRAEQGGAGAGTWAVTGRGGAGTGTGAVADRRGVGPRRYVGRHPGRPGDGAKERRGPGGGGRKGGAKDATGPVEGQRGEGTTRRGG